MNKDHLQSIEYLGLAVALAGAQFFRGTFYADAVIAFLICVSIGASWGWLKSAMRKRRFMDDLNARIALRSRIQK